MSNICDTSLADAIEDALLCLEETTLCREGRVRLLRYIVRNHPEARGHDATEEVIAHRLFDESVTNVRRAIEAFRDSVAPSREADALAPLREFLTVAIAALVAADFENLGHELTAFSYIRNRLSQSEPPPSPQAEARRTAIRGWDGQEQEFLAAELQDGETLGSFDPWRAITTTGRVIVRAELREKYRPGSWTRVDKWLAQFPEIPEEQE